MYEGPKNLYCRANPHIRIHKPDLFQTITVFRRERFHEKLHKFQRRMVLCAHICTIKYPNPVRIPLCDIHMLLQCFVFFHRVYLFNRVYWRSVPIGHLVLLAEFLKTVRFWILFAFCATHLIKNIFKGCAF